MRHIQKKISIEQLVSRLPSTLPAFMDDGIYFFDEFSIQGREGLYPTNYGMTPINIILNVEPNGYVYSGDSAYTAYTMVEGCHCYGDSAYTVDDRTSADCFHVDVESVSTYDDFCDYFTLSFKSLSNWYHFFKEYYNLLKPYGHCGRVYTSAEDYYNYESVSKFTSKMKYGQNKQTYLDLDIEFANKGGVVWVYVFNKISSEYSWVSPEDAHDENSGDTTSIVDVEDRGFYKWICDNIVPSFTIPMEYRDYWNKDILYYSDVLKWIPWFENREKYSSDNIFHKGTSGEVDTWDCKESDDCCDCEEYYKRGGFKILDLMKDWNKNIQKVIQDINDMVFSPDSNEPLNCFIPTIIMPMTMQTSIDDLGEYSIFSKDYELGIDYRVSSGYSSANTLSGTVVTIDDNSMILTSGCGYTFDSNFMELKRDDNGFSSYTNNYIDSNTCNEFNVDFNYYTFDENNVLHTSKALEFETAKEELKENLSEFYPIIKNKNGWVLIDNVLYEIKESEYGEYDDSNVYIGGKTFFVYREEDTNTPYVIMNGKKIYANFYEKEMVYYFPFFLAQQEENETCSGKTFNINNYKQFSIMPPYETKKYIEYKGTYYVIDNTSDGYLTIDGNDEPIINGYADTSIGRLYCWNGDTANTVAYRYDSFYLLYPIETSSINNDNIVLDYVKEFTVYPVNEITGRTVSKLLDFKKLNTLVDDVGNEIDGIYDIGKNIKNYQPQEGKELEPLYQVGNTYNISRFKLTAEKLDDVKDEINYFVGNIITQMKFYYKTYNETISAVTTVDLPTSGVVSGYTSLDAISASTKLRMDIEESGSTFVEVFMPDIYCDITYYIGATLSRKNGEGYVLAENMNHGVEYHETVRFVKAKREYYLQLPRITENDTNKTLNKPSKHSISYPIYVYELAQDYETINSSQYNPYQAPMATFKAEINTFGYDKKGIFYDGENYTNNFSGNGESDMAIHNNMEAYPVFREEYRLGISSLENIDSDIYIDRGINSAYEKHLKLGEVTSLEALEQYGLNFFKIMEN